MGRAQLALEILPGRHLITREYTCADDTAYNPFPERAACSGPQRALHSLASLAHESGACAQPGRQESLHLLADTACQDRCLAPRADGNEDRGAIHDSGENKRGHSRIVDRIHRNVLLTGSGRNRSVHFWHTCSGNDRGRAGDMLWGEDRIYVLQLALCRQLTQLIAQCRRDDRDFGARSAQQLDLASGDAAAADDENGPVSQLQKDRKVIHGAHGTGLYGT